MNLPMRRSGAVVTASVSSCIASTSTQTKRRKAARPGEIIDAATSLFAEKGFAATRLEEVARRANVSKGTIYVYFDTKESLFRAVARAALGNRLIDKDGESASFSGPLAEVLPRLISRFVNAPAGSGAPTMARMVFAEAHNFPDLARIWHDEVALPFIDQIAQIIARSTDIPEDPGRDPRLVAFSVVGPLAMALLHRAAFGQIEGYMPDLDALAKQHSDILLRGLLVQQQLA